jgi:CIC family chloride channel protein
MGAVVAAATHAPITAIIMIFELTQTINIIPPLMAACVVSTLVTTFMEPESIYTLKLARRGIDLYAEKGHNVLKNLFVHDIIDTEPDTLPKSANLQTVIDRVLVGDSTQFFVVNDQDELVGVIYLRELTRMLVEQEILQPLVIAEDLMGGRAPTLTEDDNLDVAMQMFSGGVGDQVAVVDAENSRKLVGCIHKNDVLQAYNREVMLRDLAGSVSSNVMVASKGQQVEIGGGYVLQEILPPNRYFGHTIRELDIQATTGVHVVLLRKRRPSDGGPEVRVPIADDSIEEGDRLVVAGTKADVEAFDEI